MANKAKRMLSNMSEQEIEQIINKAGHIDETATPLKQARYINNFYALPKQWELEQKTVCGNAEVTAYQTMPSK
ncbi:MAG: hypothetical protein JXK07_01780 [Spirochaetes bacterium]|nr:hypothetical protein [Spirochaetota bacterium]MBN2770745.1 hypothetical protein [Spirochaetota bacterium]